MTDPLPQRLSDLLERRASALADSEADRGAASPTIVLGSREAGGLDAHPQTRRTFLTRVSALSIAIPGLGAALDACSQPGGSRADSARGATHQPASTPTGAAPVGQGVHNSDSRLDSSVLKGEHHGGTSATGSATAGAAGAAYRRYDPTLPPLAPGGRLQLHWHAREAPVRISDDTVVAGWTFEGDIPGPIVHTRVGDTVEFTLTNDADIPHSMDFHAAQVNPKEAFRSVIRGQSVSFSFTPKYAGAFVYHCGTAPVLMHIGSGMFGAIIVSPREPLPPAKEFVLVQNEFYLADVANGVRASAYQKMLDTVPDVVAFNGRPSQYVKEPLRAKVGDRVRFWVVSAGPSHPCNFHVVGDQFDAVYLGAPPATPLRGVQTFSVPPGGGMVFELLCDVAGEFPFVNHGFGHGQKGAIGILVVEP